MGTMAHTAMAAIAVRRAIPAIAAATADTVAVLPRQAMAVVLPRLITAAGLRAMVAVAADHTEAAGIPAVEVISEEAAVIPAAVAEATPAEVAVIPVAAIAKRGGTMMLEPSFACVSSCCMSSGCK